MSSIWTACFNFGFQEKKKKNVVHEIALHSISVNNHNTSMKLHYIRSPSITITLAQRIQQIVRFVLRLNTLKNSAEHHNVSSLHLWWEYRLERQAYP